jgi:hypothetical protein
MSAWSKATPTGGELHEFPYLGILLKFVDKVEFVLGLDKNNRHFK